MSRPTVVIVCILAPPNRGGLNSTQTRWHFRAVGGAVHSIKSRHWGTMAYFAALSLFSGLLCRFRYSPVECPSNKFYGINCRPKLGTKLLDRFLHRRRQVSPPVNRLTHRFFDGSQHFLYCNFTVGSRHSAVAPSFSR